MKHLLNKKKTISLRNDIGLLAVNRNIPSFSVDQAQTCKGDTTENEILMDLKKKQLTSHQEIIGLQKSFMKLYETIIKLIKKKDNDKRFTRNSRSISLIKVGTKLISKVSAVRLKNVLDN